MSSGNRRRPALAGRRLGGGFGPDAEDLGPKLPPDWLHVTTDAPPPLASSVTRASFAAGSEVAQHTPPPAWRNQDRLAGQRRWRPARPDARVCAGRSGSPPQRPRVRLALGCIGVTVVGQQRHRKEPGWSGWAAHAAVDRPPSSSPPVLTAWAQPSRMTSCDSLNQLMTAAGWSRFRLRSPARLLGLGRRYHRHGPIR